MVRSTCERQILVAKKVKKASKKKTPAKKATTGNRKAALKAAKAKKAAVKKKASNRVANIRKTSKKTTKVPQTRTTEKSAKSEKLTPKEIEGFRRLLLEKWEELLGDVSHIEGEALRKSRLDAAGDLSSMPIHMADLGTDNFEQEFALGLMDSERKILMEIVAALRRIKEGTYGICEGTGKYISKARLQANPWARYCIEYARMVEKGLITEGEKVYSRPEESDEEDEEEAFDDEMDELDEDYEDEHDETPDTYDEEDELEHDDEDTADFLNEDEEGEEDDLEI